MLLTNHDIPQSNSLPRIRLVVGAIVDGAVTSEAIAERLGMQRRQVAYALQAARVLGWAEALPEERAESEAAPVLHDGQALDRQAPDKPEHDGQTHDGQAHDGQTHGGQEHDEHDNGHGHAWTVTAAGTALLGSLVGSEGERALFRAAFERSPQLQALVPHLLDARRPSEEQLVLRLVRVANCARETAVRRAQTLLAWRDQILDPQGSLFR